MNNGIEAQKYGTGTTHGGDMFAFVKGRAS